MSQAVEQKVIEKIVALLLADSVIAGYVKTQIYGSHISSIGGPKYPAISIHLLRSTPAFANPEMVQVDLQIDTWMPSSRYNLQDILVIQQRIRSVLNRQNLIDTTISLKVGMTKEIGSGPLLHEDDTDLLHYPSEYLVVGA